MHYTDGSGSVGVSGSSVGPYQGPRDRPPNPYRENFQSYVNTKYEYMAFSNGYPNSRKDIDTDPKALGAKFK